MDDPDAPADFDVDALLDACAAATLAEPDAGWDVVVVRADRRRLLAAIPLPPLGATVVRPAEAGSALGLATPVLTADRSIDNGLVRVEVADDGSYAVEGGGSRLAGVGRIVDGGDYGDTYNYGPPADDRLVERPDRVVVRVTEHGPVRGRIEIVAGYAWPVGLGGGERSRRSDDTAPVTVVTRLELRAGEPFVRVELAFTNPSRDHRVRVHIPLPASADHSSAEGQFAVVDRGLTAEAGHGEVPTPTFPAHGFVHAAGVTVLLEHVTEYELVAGRELALTVLRSTGLISRNDNPFREDPAGPEVPVPGAQMLGPWRFAFALLPHTGSWDAVDAHRAADRFRLPATVVPGRGPADAPAAMTEGLRVDGHGVVLSALRRTGDELELRLVAETPRATRATVSLPGGIGRAREVDLLGRSGAPIPVPDDGRLDIALGAWEIRTIRLTRPATGGPA
jgi:alpha-mannosidase